LKDVLESRMMGKYIVKRSSKETNDDLILKSMRKIEIKHKRRRGEEKGKGEEWEIWEIQCPWPAPKAQKLMIIIIMMMILF